MFGNVNVKIKVIYSDKGEWYLKLKEGGKFIVSGYAHTEGEVKEKRDLIEQARQLGRDMAKSLKNTP